MEYSQDNLPNMYERELLESMTPRQIIEHIIKLGNKVSEIERDMNLASEVLEDAYGLTVDSVLSEGGTTLVALEGGEYKNGEQE